MNTQTISVVQVKSYQNDMYQPKRRTQLRLKKRPQSILEKAEAQSLNSLKVPAFLLSKRSKRGDVRSLLMYNEAASVMLARRAPRQQFIALARIKHQGLWQCHTTRLQSGLLFDAVNSAQEFLMTHGSEWSVEPQLPPTVPSEKLMREANCLGINFPPECSIHLAKALMHAHHFVRVFDAAYQSRPWVNASDARVINFEELQNAQ